MKKYSTILILTTFIFPAIGQAQSSSQEIKVPFKFALGKGLFEKHCSSCHGNGVDKKGPPLMHKYYEPLHHGDESLYRASLKGVKAHHWNFGDMNPVPGITRRDVG